MKYIKLFKNDAEYQAFKGGGDYITPNLCLNSETWETKCEPEKEISLFPMYLTTLQGSGYERNRATDEQSLVLLDYFNKHAIIQSDEHHTWQQLDLNENILYIDELKITAMYTEPHFHDKIVLVCNDIFWINFLLNDGSITLEYDD